VRLRTVLLALLLLVLAVAVAVFLVRALLGDDAPAQADRPGSVAQLQ
jgi:hypothetical protein